MIKEYYLVFYPWLVLLFAVLDLLLAGAIANGYTDTTIRKGFKGFLIKLCAGIGGILIFLMFLLNW